MLGARLQALGYRKELSNNIFSGKHLWNFPMVCINFVIFSNQSENFTRCQIVRPNGRRGRNATEWFADMDEAPFRLQWLDEVSIVHLREQNIDKYIHSLSVDLEKRTEIHLYRCQIPMFTFPEKLSVLDFMKSKSNLVNMIHFCPDCSKNAWYLAVRMTKNT